jgi:3-isopropylmalate/(R)-2-methylmalate dehydratase small subunit
MLSKKRLSLILKGNVHKYGADVNTDVIIPGRYMALFEPEDLAKHCMEDIDQDFISRAKPGDIMVATTNFGCGSAREHAPLAIKSSGISCIIAKSFARIFYRNAINIGLPLIECESAVENTKSGDLLEADLDSGVIKNITTGRTFSAEPFSPFIAELISDGGLIEHTRKKLAAMRS